MNLNFAEVLRQLGPDAAFRIINGARPNSDYHLSAVLPNRPRASYEVRNGTMTVRTTMAGLVGMDSPYPIGGLADADKFVEGTAKLAIRVPLPEGLQREMQDFLMRMGLSQTQNLAEVRNTVLNFYNKLIVQALLDTEEWARGRALTTGKLQWTFGSIALDVDYGVPSAQLPAQRTGNDGYGGSASKWWTDHRAARKFLKQQVATIIAHPNTIDMIVSNPANNIQMTAQDVGTGSYSFVKIKNTTTGQVSEDVRDRVTLIAHSGEGEILDPANPGKTKTVPFVPEGKIIYIGKAPSRSFQVGMGSATETPSMLRPLGYTHIGPTVEAGGRLGRWGRIFTPQDEPYRIVAEGVENFLPVIENTDRLYVLDTEMV